MTEKAKKCFKVGMNAILEVIGIYGYGLGITRQADTLLL